MSAESALNARRNAEQAMTYIDKATRDTEWLHDITVAQAWALIAIATELAEIRKTLEAK